MSEPKDIIFKNYVKKHPLGEGNYGAVYLVENDKGISFALKVLFRDVELFERETAEIAGIRSSRLVQVLDWGKTVEGRPCVLMEYMPGNLDSVLEWDNISESRAMELFREILHGLEALESFSLLHRDLKPANLFLYDNIIKIGDFGSSKITSGESSSMSQNAAMTLHYSAPERFDDENGYGFEVDRWSAVVIFCRMLTGEVPFAAKSKSLQSIMKAICMGKPDISAVPDYIKPFFERAFQKDMRKRHACVAEMREHFESCISEYSERLHTEEIKHVRQEMHDLIRAEVMKQQILERGVERLEGDESYHGDRLENSWGNSNERLQILGDKFRDERLKQGLTVEQIMEITGLSRVSITAIENGYTEELPHVVYAVGLVGKYARVLGFDPEEVDSYLLQDVQIRQSR